MPDTSERVNGVLSEASARRLSNQIARAYRGTYGARTGLRTIVRSVARQMLRSGVSPDVVSQTFEHCVRNHPACLLADPRHAVTGKLQSTTLVELAQECVAEVAREAPAA